MVTKKIFLNCIMKICLVLSFILIFCFYILGDTLELQSRPKKKRKLQSSEKPLVQAEKREYTIVIDPGHGSAPTKKRDDRWDPITRQYISFSNYGSQYKNYHEHIIVLVLAKKLVKYLDLTRTNWGWGRFKYYLKKFSKSKQPLPRIKFITHLTRKQSWKEDGLDIKNPQVNAPYRLFDYPNPKKKNEIKPGRISRINQAKPYLVLSLHTDTAGKSRKGGMAVVLSPGYKTFNLLRQISLKKKAKKLFFSNPWQRYWIVTRKKWSRFQSAYSDAWVYFHGHNTKKDTLRNAELKYYRGIRHNLVTWRYKENKDWVKLARTNTPPYSNKHHSFVPRGKFWKRERSQFEAWRREGGILSFGGDNHYAGNELLRYVQLGTRLLVNEKSKSHDIGAIQNPYVSAYAMPIYVNAITAYLEIAYINRKRDRQLLIKNRDTVALSLAIGIYSLFIGIKTKENNANPYPPRGTRINWERYTKSKDGNYFKKAVL